MLFLIILIILILIFLQLKNILLFFFTTAERPLYVPSQSFKITSLWNIFFNSLIFFLEKAKKYFLINFEFLIASAKHKIWNNVFKDEKKEISKLKSLKETEYAKRVQHEFLSEYNRAVNLKIPKGYSFRIEGKIEEPNLMQKLTAAKVVHERRIERS